MDMQAPGPYQVFHNHINTCRTVPHACKGFKVFEPPPMPEHHNIWRESALRYIGYADEVGESLEPYMGKAGLNALNKAGLTDQIRRGVVPDGLKGKLIQRMGLLGKSGPELEHLLAKRLVEGTYGISALYSLVDILVSAKQNWKTHNHHSQWHRIRRTGEEIVDGALFHTAATVYLPAKTLKYVRIGTQALMKHPRLPVGIKRLAFLPSAVPLILLLPVGKVIDKLVDHALDATWRKWIGLIHPPKPVLISSAQLHENRLRATQSGLQQPQAFSSFNTTI